MANRTAKYANTIHGTNPQYLIEKIVRERIYDCRYWQEDCFFITSAQVLEHAVDDLKYVGCTYGNKLDPTPFLCLVLKLLQIQPKKEIVYLYIDQPDFKYLRALGAFYLRLTGRPVEIYEKLEPIYNDYRKIRIMDSERKFSVIHMDEFIDILLGDEKVFSITMPRLTRRIVLEDNRDIEPYRSKLEEQNLIPNLPIVENAIEGKRDVRGGDRLHNRYESSSYRKRESSSSHRRSDHDRHDHHSQRRSREYYHGEDHGGRVSHRDRDRKDRDKRPRERPKSPQEKKNYPQSYARGSGKFSQKEIDDENVIRAKVGLKPLY